MCPESVPGAKPPSWSLERRLPLVVSLLLAAMIVISIVFSWLEVRRSGLNAATIRLSTSSSRLAQLFGVGPRQRLAMLTEVGAHPRVQGILATGSMSDSSEVAALLEPLATDADPDLPVQLLSVDGEVLVSVGAGTYVGAAPPIGQDSLRSGEAYGPVFVDPSGLMFWTVAPVRSGDRIAGYITEPRRLVVGGAQQIEEIIGPGAAVYLTGRNTPLRITLDGVIDSVPLGFVMSDTATFTHDDPVHGMQLAHVEAIPGTAWSITVETPLYLIHAGARAFLRRAVPFGALMIIAAAVLSWSLSRTLTAPLKDLRSAATAIASGDYSRRVNVTRTDELGDVGMMFNTMADHIQTTHEALGARFEEAQLLSEELEQSMGEADAAREEALAANRAKADFLATMSHEIRTPINAVVGFADLLEIGVAGELSPEQRRYVQRIKVSGRHLAALVADILDFAKIESGHMRVESEAVPVQDVVKSALTMIEPSAGSRRITLNNACTRDLYFAGDRRRAEQILLNLLSNGVKFSAAGGSVTVTSASTDAPPHAVIELYGRGQRWIGITVQDNGIGMDADQIARFFEPFVQAETGYTRSHGGSGLGLSISRKLALLMRGELTVESVPSNGSSFTIWLPAAMRGRKTAANVPDAFDVSRSAQRSSD
jgi:signal transduction histidine kinase